MKTFAAFNWPIKAYLDCRTLILVCLEKLVRLLLNVKKQKQIFFLKKFNTEQKYFNIIFVDSELTFKMDQNPNSLMLKQPWLILSVLPLSASNIGLIGGRKIWSKYSSNHKVENDKC